FKSPIKTSFWIVSGFAAAAILLITGLIFWLEYRSKSETALDQAFLNSYGDCKIGGTSVQTGENILDKRLDSGSFSICEFQFEGTKSVSVRVLPDSQVSLSGTRKNSSLNVKQGSVLIDSISKESTDPEEAGVFSVLSPDVKARLLGTKIQYSRIVSESYSQLDLEILEGSVEMETGPYVAFEKIANSLTNEERAVFQLEFPALFKSSKVVMNHGQALSWRGISEAGLSKIESLGKVILEAKSKGIALHEDFFSSLAPDLKTIKEERNFSIEKDLDKKIRNLLPTEEQELEEKFKSMVRFPPSDLKEVEKLKSLVSKLDNTPLIQILKDRNQPDMERVIYFKDGSKVKGFVYQHENFYILLKSDGNLLFPVDAVDSIEFE
ncbi:LIMLP_03685 family anti-sigma factor, partial [Leptospira ellisii]